MLRSFLFHGVVDAAEKYSHSFNMLLTYIYHVVVNASDRYSHSTPLICVSRDVVKSADIKSVPMGLEMMLTYSCC